MNQMLAGRFRLCAGSEKDERSLCLAFGLDRGEELRYLDDKQMGKVYLVPASDRSVVAGFNAVGIEPLSAAFTVDRLTGTTMVLGFLVLGCMMLAARPLAAPAPPASLPPPPPAPTMHPESETLPQPELVLPRQPSGRVVRRFDP